MKRAWRLSRDNARTPMQWNSSDFGGFSSVTPWIGINPNYKNINVENQLIDKNSILNFYKSMIKIRKEYEALIYGEYKLILENDTKIYAYERVLNDSKFLVISNMSNDNVLYNYDEVKLNYKNLILSNIEVKEHDIISLVNLKPWECRLYKI